LELDARFIWKLMKNDNSEGPRVDTHETTFNVTRLDVWMVFRSWAAMGARNASVVIPMGFGNEFELIWEGVGPIFYIFPPNSTQKSGTFLPVF